MRQVAILFLLSLACASHSTLGADDHLGAPGVILHGSEAAQLLRPCTRPAPNPVDSIWDPGADAVTAFEAALPRAFKQQSWEHPGWGPNRPLSAYRGQYAGFYREGQRLLYGSFSLRNDTTVDFGRNAMVICDGPGRYFGAVFDPLTGQVTSLVGNEGGSVLDR